MKKDLTALAVLVCLIALTLSSDGWARVGYVALAAALGCLGLWLKARGNRKAHPRV